MLIHLIYMAIGLLGIGLVIFLHELGHFIAARSMGCSHTASVLASSPSMALIQSTGYLLFHSEDTAG